MSKVCVTVLVTSCYAMLSDTIHACATLEREFKEIGQNLRTFGSSKYEFRFQAVEPGGGGGTSIIEGGRDVPLDRV